MSRWLVFVGAHHDAKYLRSDHAVNLDEATTEDWGLCVMRIGDRFQSAVGYVIVEAESEEAAITEAESYYVIDGQLRRVK